MIGLVETRWWDTVTGPRRCSGCSASSTLRQIVEFAGDPCGSAISSGSRAAASLRATIDLAIRAEELGYRRFWIAEYHFAGVAGSSPATQVALVASATRRIRVGAAAVQIGLHQPAAIVEAFGMIDALYRGRLELGLGRSPQRLSEAVSAAQKLAAPESAPGMQWTER